MRKLALTLVPLALLSTFSLAALQERVKPKQPQDFAALHEEVGALWASESWSQCFAKAQELVGIIGVRRSQAIRAALPAAPEGYEKEGGGNDADQQQANPFAAAAAGIAGSIVEQRYRSADKRKQISVTVHAGSPLIKMMQVWVDNPAMLGPDSELIKYESYNAVLKTSGKRLELQIMIDDNLVSTQTDDEDDEFLLAMWSDAAVKKAAAALTK